MRIDHPDFGNVLRCTYAKGVITDFELAKNEDGSDKTDPFTVISKVKVRIGDEDESDFIPLFFHPKAQYWDDDPDVNGELGPIKATDFNAENKYFEKAWMSFRGGDEVAVLMRATEDDPELKPFAVIGFADGVPRIGEHIVKVSYETLHYLEDIKIYVGGTEPPVIWEEIYVNYLPGQHFRYLRMYEYEDCAVPLTNRKYNYYGDLDEDKLGPDETSLRLLTEITNSINDLNTTTIEDTYWTVPILITTHNYYTRYAIPVGAILFVIEYLWYYAIVDQIGGPYPSYIHTKKRYMLDTNVQAGIYNQINYEAAITINTKTQAQRRDDYFNDREWFESIEGFTRQITHECLALMFYAFYYEVPGMPESAIRFDPGNLSFYVRPHTKDELIEAKMWPKEEEE